MTLPDLEKCLAVLQALGPMEFDADERELVGQAMGELDRISREAMHKIAGNQP